MRKSQEYARISITLPEDTLEAADRMAVSLSRSRSWVIAEAVRRLADSGGYAMDAPMKPVVSGAGPQLSPEGCVRSSEEAARQDITRPPRPVEQLLSFTRYEDYLAWDLRSRIRP